MDLEWNGAYSHKAHGYFNEIIEIGAVKLDASFQIVDRFQAVIKPSVSRKLSEIVKGLTHIAPEELDKGGSFVSVVHRLQDWMGTSEAAFLTWSQTDLLVLMENFRYFCHRQDIPMMAYYADIQRYCQEKMGISLHQQMGLQAACENLNIDTQGMETHRALGDSLMTAEVLRRVGDPPSFHKILQKADKVFYDRVTFKPFVLKDIDSPLIDRSLLRFSCPECGRNLRRKGEWAFCGHAFFADFTCRRCRKNFVGRVQFKQKYDCVDVKRKLTEKIEPPKEKGAGHEQEG